MRRFLPLLALAAVLAGCAEPAGGRSAETPTVTTEATDPAAGGDIAQADNDLQVEIDRGAGSEPETYTLTCVGFVEGDHPEPEAACAHLAGLAEPFAPLPADQACTQQYGGPETARVIGRWNGEPVDVDLARTDGCQIAQWDSLGPLLPGPVG